jgi:hypothetical protein
MRELTERLMSIQAIFAELQSKYARMPKGRGGPLVTFGDSDVDRWAADAATSRAGLYDMLAFQLALGFHGNEFSFSFCDWVVNELHRVIVYANEDRPDLFWEVFLAFDAGEYYHDHERKEDPVEKFTHPLIAQVLEKYSRP